MRQMLILATGLATVCGGLSACATPAYPIVASQAPPAQPASRKSQLAQVSPGVSSGPAPSTPAVVTEHDLPAPAAAAAGAGLAPVSPAVETPPAAGKATSTVTPQSDSIAARPISMPRARLEGRMIATGKVVKATRMFRDYQVQKGDHLFAIARDFQTTADQLVDANDLKSANTLRPGQHLKIPIEKAYVAESGDTLSAVAKRFGVAAADLSELNNLPERGRLRVGDKIALPAHFDDHGPFRLAPETADAAPARRSPRTPRVPSSILTPGLYVPSQSALEEAARHRVEAQNPPTDSTPYRPSPAYAAAPLAITSTDVIAAGRGRFVWPVQGDILSAFGLKGLGRKNDGLDIKAAQGTAVHAAAAGEVVYAGDQVPGFGNLVLIKHADGWVTAYAHLDRALVRMRQSVAQGDEIGEVGLSGGVTEPQLHFEIRYAPHPTDKAKPLDPQLILPK